EAGDCTTSESREKQACGVPRHGAGGAALTRGRPVPGERAVFDEGLQQARDAGHLVGEQVAREIDDVGTKVAECSATSLLAAQPPGEREARVDEPILKVLGATVADLAEPALGD